MRHVLLWMDALYFTFFGLSGSRLRPNARILQPFILLVQLNFVSGRTGATTACAAISVAYEKHQTANETKALQNPATCLSCAAQTVYQLGLRRKQTCPSSEQLYSGTKVEFVTLLQHSAARSSEKHLNSPQNE